VHAQLRTQHKLLSHTPLLRPDPSPSPSSSPSRPLSTNPNEFVQFEQVHTPHDDLLGPNRLVGYCDGGLPGALPTINEEAVRQVCRTGHAIGGQVQSLSRFDRKHYSYPDLPNSYQITQQFHPLVYGGEITIHDADYATLASDFDPSLLPSSQADQDYTDLSDRKRKRIQEQLAREAEKKERLGVRTLENLVPAPLPTAETPRVIRVNRIHLEHDSGKSQHDQEPAYSLIDLNRSGMALMEIVSEPDIRSSLEAALFVRKLQNILTHIRTAHTTMESGAMRCDLNISVRREGDTRLGVRSEVKNLSSIKHLKAACDAEIRRHVETLSRGLPLYQETRGFHFDTLTTYTQRRKETEVDYRFMPDPDLPVLRLTQAQMKEMSEDIPAHPDYLRERYINQLAIPLDKAMTLLYTPHAAEYLNQVCAGGAHRSPALVANWLVVELFGLLARDQISVAQSPVCPEQLGSIIDLLHEETISGKIGKKILQAMYTGDTRLAQPIVTEQGWAVQNEEGAIQEACQQVLTAHPDKVAQYCQAGEKRERQRLIKFFMGEMMKASQGRLHPQATSSILLSLLSSSSHPKEGCPQDGQ